MSLSKTISGNNSADVVAAVSGRRILVTSFLVTGAAAETIKFQSGGSTDLTGAMSMTTTNTLSPSYVHEGLFVTAEGEKLNYVLGASGTVNVAGMLTYRIIP